MTEVFVKTALVEFSIEVEESPVDALGSVDRRIQFNEGMTDVNGTLRLLSPAIDYALSVVA